MKRGFLTPTFFLFLSSMCFSIDGNFTEVLENEFRLNGTSIQSAFGDARESALETTVRLERNNKLIALGTLINSEGFVLTKASSCVGAREAILRNGKSYGLKIRKRFEELDLALYQLITDKSDFSSVKWDDTNQSNLHSWVASSFVEIKQIRVGIASGNLRAIGREGGVIGVILANDGKKLGGVSISEVIPQSAGDRAGLLAKDLILKIDGRAVIKREQVIKLVGSKDPGDLVNLEIRREKQIKKLGVTLGHRSVTFDLFNRNLQMSGPVSKRKDNFPSILQHDLPLPKEAMGGPLFNLEGKCIGINIARVDRVTTFALPTDTILAKIDGWLGMNVTTRPPSEGDNPKQP